MNRRIWTSFTLLTALLLVFPAIPQEASAEQPEKPEECKQEIKFKLGSKVAEDSRGIVLLTAAPYLEKESMMVPLRSFAEGIRAELQWDNETSSITLISGDRSVRVRLGESRALVNEKTIDLLAPITLIGDKAYGPVRQITHALGGVASWDQASKSTSITAASCARAIEVSFSFAEGAEGWTGDFADLPVDRTEKSDFRLEKGWGSIPTADKQSVNGFLLQGMNRSDDLFMFVKRPIGSVEGLQPQTSYQVDLSFDLGTDTSRGLMGIGGAPGEAVTVKAGVLNREPIPIRKEEAVPYYRMNIDTGSQTKGGADMQALGNLVKPQAEIEGYQLKPFTANFKATTDENGQLWLILGTDSGYEGLTRIYFTHIQAKFKIDL